MKTGLERIAAKARQENKLRFTSLAHHITKELVWESLDHIPTSTSPGVDGVTVYGAKETFKNWIDEMLKVVHHQGYHPPAVRRVYIPKPGKKEKRPIGIPCVADRALQRSVSMVLSAIWEEEFLPCSFGGRPGCSAHRALSTLNEIIVGKKVSWVLEADLKNFFGSLDHGWLLQFVEHRVGDPRILSLIRRWLKAGILEDGEVKPNEEGTPQGGSISVLLSNIYLHYVLDLWFEKAIKPRLQGEAYLVRYLDDFVVCFQFQTDALRFQEVLKKRLEKYALRLEPTKTKLVEFGRFAMNSAKKKGKKPETIYFLGFTHYCTTNRKGNFKVGRKTEKSRLKRSLTNLKERMRKIRHGSLEHQADKINLTLRGHYAYYEMGGNFASINKVFRFAQWYWHKMLSSRSQKGYIKWKDYMKVLSEYPLQTPKIFIPYGRMSELSVL
jgi:group II intron reverse transcriptase/maturase